MNYDLSNEDVSALLFSLDHLKKGLRAMEEEHPEHARRAKMMLGDLEGLVSRILAARYPDGPDAERLRQAGRTSPPCAEDPPIGMVEADDPTGQKREFCAAIYGDGRLANSAGTWGRFGIIQILPAVAPMPMDAKVDLATIAPGAGIMLMFRDPAAVARMVDQLNSIKWGDVVEAQP